MISHTNDGTHCIDLCRAFSCFTYVFNITSPEDSIFKLLSLVASAPSDYGISHYGKFNLAAAASSNDESELAFRLGGGFMSKESGGLYINLKEQKQGVH